jgi:predicted enzyme related to lactoylglutathione lyase
MTVATLGPVVLDCPEPQRLAEFYGAVLGWSKTTDDADWTVITGPHGQSLAFQRSLGHQPPQWPSTERPQQFHLDLDVPTAEMDAAEKEVLALGATLLQGDDNGARAWRVYADPAGHPFCLCAV